MEYLEALERSILYMEKHLEEAVSVHDVAKAAGYSYYHFTRIFQAVLGESIGHYLQKRRLASAAQKLLYSDQRIIDIAMESRFDSPESFSRAFKSVYQVSPTAYRSNRLDVFIGNKKEIDHDFLRHIASNLTVHPQIKVTDNIYVAGIRGTEALDNLFALWQQFTKKQGSILNKHPSGKTFGICEYQENTAIASYGMEVCEVIGAEVMTLGKQPPDIITKIIPAGKFAVFTHKGPLSDILKTYQYIWGTWALLTSEVIDERDDFELYGKGFTGRENKDSEIDIFIPIK